MSVRKASARCASALLALVLLESARARGAEGEARPGSWSAAVRQAASSGAYLPLTLAPSVGPASAQAAGFAGYSSAERAAVMQSQAEAHAYGPLALRVGVRLNERGKEVGPSIGARLQLLSQERHGLNAGVALVYKAEGFDEPEGEIEGVLSFSRRLDRWLLLAGLAYGQDPEGRERDGELALATLWQADAWLNLGLDARARLDLGSKRARLLASLEPTFDLDAGPVATFALGPIAFSVHGGIALSRSIDQASRAGVVALAGLGTAF
jgi:hypothetical protein